MRRCAGQSAPVAAKGVDLSKVRALAFDGSTHNAVLMDAGYKPIRKTIMWTDQRSVAECALLREKYGETILKTAYQSPSPTWTLPQMMWLKNNEPEILKKTKRVLFVKDYVRYLLTGVAVSDYIEAQGTLFFDMKTMSWSRELVELSGLDFDALPKLVKPTDAVGRVGAKAAADTGLPEGALVVCGHERFRRGRLRRGRGRSRRLHRKARHRRQRERHDRRTAPVQNHAHILARR